MFSENRFKDAEDSYSDSSATLVQAADPDEINKSQKLFKETKNLLRSLQQEQQLEKGRRHFLDAFNYRLPNNDLQNNKDNSLFLLCYYITQSTIYVILTVLLSTVALFVAFFQENYTARCVSAFLVSVFVVESLIDWVRVSCSAGSLREKYFNVFFISKRLCILAYLAHVIYLLVIVQYNKYLMLLLIPRSLLVFFFSDGCRKLLISLMRCYQEVAALVLLNVCLISIETFVAITVINYKSSNYEGNFKDFGNAFGDLYILSSFDGYPQFIDSSVDQSQLYQIFFFFHISVYVFFVLVIPTSIIFQAFRAYRTAIVLEDELVRKSCLLIVYICLDSDINLKLDQNQFRTFMQVLYFKKKRLINYIPELMRKLAKQDKENQLSIPLNSFLNICDIFQKYNKFQPPFHRDWVPWVNFRKSVNRAFSLKPFLRSIWFKAFSALLVLANCVLLIINYVADLHDPSLAIAIRVFFFYFLLELVIKIIGLGFKPFKSLINQLQLFFIIFAIISFEILVPLNQRMNSFLATVQLFRLYRVFAFLQDLQQHLQLKLQIKFLQRFSNFMSSVFLSCIVVFKMLPILILICLTFGMIGMVAFGVQQLPSTQYSKFQSAGFTDLYSVMLMEVQIMVESQWGAFIFNNAEYFGYASAFTFYFFNHILVVHILIALLKGQCWEVYTAVEEELAERNALQQDDENEEEEHLQEQQGSEEHSQNGRLPEVSDKVFHQHLLNQIMKEYARRNHTTINQLQERMEPSLPVAQESLPKRKSVTKFADFADLLFVHMVKLKDSAQTTLLREFVEEGMMTCSQAQEQSSLEGNVRYQRLMLNQIRSQLKIKQRIRRNKLDAQASEQIQLLNISEQNAMMFLTFNSKYMLRKMLLNNMSDERWSLITKKHFQLLYPNFYQNVNTEVLSSLIKNQSKFTESINFLLKSKVPPSTLHFFLNLILQKISETLMPEGSNLLLLYSDDELLNHWFYFSNGDQPDDETYRIQVNFFKGQHFIWAEDVFTQGDIYLGRNILNSAYPYQPILRNIILELSPSLEDKNILTDKVNLFLLNLQRPAVQQAQPHRLIKRLMLLLVENRPSLTLPEQEQVKEDSQEQQKMFKGQPQFLTLQLMQNLKDMMVSNLGTLFSSAEWVFKHKWGETLKQLVQS